MKVAGVNTWTARAFLIPCMLLAISGVWLLGRHLGNDPRLGDLSALVFATSLFPLAASTVISTDFPLTTALILAQAFFWRALRTASLGSIYAIWFFMGVAFMTKGPPSLLVLPAMAVTWRLLPREQRKAVPLFTPGALALYFLISVSWYAWEACHHPGLLHYWVHDEVINRSTTNEFNRNPQFYMNFVIYLPVLLFGCWPWGGWLLHRQRKAWFLKATSVISGGISRKAWGWPALKAALSQWSIERHWSVWALFFPLLVFCLSQSKLPLYVLPLLGPLAVFIAAGLLRAFAQDSARLWKGATVCALSCWTLCVFVKGVSRFFPGDRDMKALYAAAVKQAPDLQNARLAVFGSKQLNGLQFYLQKELPDFDIAAASEIKLWLKEGGAGKSYLIMKPGLSNILSNCVCPSQAEFSPLTYNWILACVSVTPSETKVTRSANVR